jgi:hypothetical protein
MTLSDASVMKRMLEAKAELSTRPSFDMPRLAEESTKADDAGDEASSTLERRLMEIFHFDKPERVVSGKPPIPFEGRNADSNRIPVLATTKRFAARLYVHHEQAYLLLCVFTQEIC